MKRKGGHKKGKSKKSKTEPVKEELQQVSTGNVEGNSGTDDAGNDEQDSGTEVNTPSLSGTDQPAKNTANINPDGSIERTSAKPMARVKVKLKTSKALESQGTSSDAPSQSDTDKSSQKMDVDKQAIVAEKIEDSISSLLEMKAGPSEDPSKKAGSIKIKTSRPLASLGAQSADVVVLEGDNDEHQKELKDTPQASRSSKQELESALMIIKKVMKMDAAEPFNVPVDPVALGIPDYFDVIDTPMDFGTICTNIEKGEKYSNSEDVFKDVQYIWGNCYKYNNKGDYILDLMRRVKKNFMKYWAGAGLYTGNDGNQADSGQGKGGPKNKAKKRHGMRRHKNDCLCAICVLKRKRKEREERERIARGLTIEEFKQEETSRVESPYGEEGEGSSNSDDSDDEDAEGNLEEKGVKLEISPGKRNEADGEGGSEIETRKNHQGQTPDKNSLEGEPQQVKETESSAGLQENNGKRNAAADQQKLKEAQQQQTRSNLYGNFRSDNPALMSLCGILFPENPSVSVWSGPHSLVPRKRPTQSRSSIQAAIESLIN